MCQRLGLFRVLGLAFYPERISLDETGIWSPWSTVPYSGVDAEGHEQLHLLTFGEVLLDLFCAEGLERIECVPKALI